ncbi:hypothetical protein BJI67_15750 (plasmid) [Acidihalobacter aeolianus]|uniref:Transposase IS200-like domain-containing protein n=1 Tax=Acidihalobacter aeolianus TaxID=2792603 RepID=A0A1D8KCL3_9GAMM|nr:hypothetical protein [Acidihalobacter aeolianus]AOV18699.1 hypothetical protein BJI67_15750 [Acidihalobacter aeolianus]
MKIRLTEAGRCLHEQWMTLPERFNGVTLDACVMMPNRFHGIVCIQPVGAQFIAPQTPENPHAIPGTMNRAPTSWEGV